MAVARVVTFEGVSKERMDDMAQQMREDERPDDLPATEIVVLHDAGAEKALVVLFFDTEEDYQRGDETLNAMSPEDTPGKRSSVTKFDVPVRMTA